MKGRRYLNGSIVLYEEIGDKQYEKVFNITRVINEGGDAICYEAYQENSGKGVLKEYYPLYMIGLERNNKGQLGHTSEYWDSFKSFKTAREAYIKPYKMLLDIKQNSDDHDIDTFIPSFEIFHGNSDFPGMDYESTIYIWTPEPELKTFDVICEDIHSQPSVMPERKLQDALRAIQVLAECIDTLHNNEIIHRDIKPKNFGFKKRRKKVLFETLQLFDVDSLCYVFSERPQVGTIGYKAPETAYGDYSNQSDIYSIGATLFHAIIITDETKTNGFVYRDEFFDNLSDMVDSSELITASEVNSDPRLRKMLSNILGKCLDRKPKRYNDCDDLSKAVKEALYYAINLEASGTDEK